MSQSGRELANLVGRGSKPVKKEADRQTDRWQTRRRTDTARLQGDGLRRETSKLRVR